MTVGSQTNRYNKYAGAGTTGPFSYTFRILAEADLVVVKIDEDGVETVLTGNTITGVGASGGGTVTTASAIASGEFILIYSDIAATQETDYIAADAFPAASHETALDKAALIDQDRRRDIARAIRAPLGEALGDLPRAADRANGILAFDADGDIDTSRDYDGLVADIAEAAAPDVVASIETEGAAQVLLIEAAGDEQIALVEAAGTAQIALVDAAGDTAVALVEAAKDDAIADVAAAADAEFYADTTAGLAATASGDYFLVVGDDTETAYTIYLDNAGVAEEVASAPSVTYLDTTVAAIETAQEAFQLPWVVGHPGTTIPDGDSALNTQWRILNDPVPFDGTVTQFRLYSGGTSLCSLQAVRIVDGEWSPVGSAVTFTPTTGHNDVAVSIAVQRGDYLAFKPGNSVGRYLTGGDQTTKGFGSGHWAASSLSGAVGTLLSEFQIQCGFDLTVTVPRGANRIDIRNSDRLVAITDSYTAGNWEIRGKGTCQVLSDFSDWRIENFGISGASATSYLSLEIRAVDLSYGDQSLRDMRASWCLIFDGENTDASGTVTDAMNAWRQLGVTVQSLGMKPVWCEQHVEIFTAGTQAIFRKLADEFGTYHFPARSYARRVENSSDRYAGFWNSQHYSIRTHDVRIGAIQPQLDLLGRPIQSIRLFRARDASAVSTVADLAFDDLFDRARLFREIYSAQRGISVANESKLDEINTFTTSGTDLFPSEYINAAMGEVIAFDDYALCEVILPTNRPLGVRLSVPAGVTAYVRDSIYYGSGYPAAAAATCNWRSLPLDADGYASFYGLDVPAKVFDDKVTFLLYKSSAWEWQDPHVLWVGEPGKLPPPKPNLAWAKGAELLAQTTTYSGGSIAAGWTSVNSPSAANDFPGGKYPPTITGHVVVNDTDKISQAVTFSSSDYDRECEIVVIAGYPRAIVVSTDTFPGTNEVTTTSFDYEQLVAEVVYGSTAIPLKREVGMWWREVRFKTVIPSNQTGFTLRLGSRSGDLAIVKASVKMMDA